MDYLTYRPLSVDWAWGLPFQRVRNEKGAKRVITVEKSDTLFQPGDQGQHQQS